MSYASAVFAVFALAIAVGCSKSPKETQEVSSVATTQSAAVRPRAYTAAECQKPELRSDERCDWYYDPMSGSQPGDVPANAPANANANANAPAPASAGAKK